MPVEKAEALRQRGQHAEREHVDLEEAERVEIVLVPFDGGAVLHRRVHDGDDLVEPVAGDDEAAAVLGEMARKAGQLPAIFSASLSAGSAGSSPAARAASSPTGVEPWPQAVPFSAVITSSERPKTFAVSRIAERVR